MDFGTSRASAIEKLNKFVDQNLIEYSKLRNFDYGPKNRSNISCLSPYITHGVISELEVIKKSLNKFSFSKNEKFIQEVLWRTYWKGWLELRPNVWSDYLIELNKIRVEFKNNQIALKTYEKMSKNSLISTLIQGNVIRLTPPLIVSSEEIRKAIKIITRSL